MGQEKLGFGGGEESLSGLLFVESELVSGIDADPDLLRDGEVDHAPEQLDQPVRRPLPGDTAVDAVELAIIDLAELEMAELRQVQLVAPAILLQPLLLLPREAVIWSSPSASGSGCGSPILTTMGRDGSLVSESLRTAITFPTESSSITCNGSSVD